MDMGASSALLSGRRFVVVSNREPFIHEFRNGTVCCMQPASGVVTAIEPIVRAAHGLWVAHGSGTADWEEVDRKGRLGVPPDHPQYTLKRVALSARQEELYYYGFANQALWPLCHVAYRRPLFEEQEWRAYQEVNRAFADAVAAELGDEPAFVFIQDYHFALLARLLKERCANVLTAQFWHIPWPNPEVFRICPWKEEILENLLDNDLLAFHLQYHCQNFLDTVARCLEAQVDERGWVHYQGVTTRVGAFPISVDFRAISQGAESDEVIRESERLRLRYNLTSRLLAIGVDRLDYTKGIADKFRAIDRFFTEYPEWKEQVQFFQLGVPTRSSIPAYRETAQEVSALAERINARHGKPPWTPLVFVQDHFSPVTLWALYRLARACVVSSLHDGMNLVAKEYVSARNDENAVLVLSQFTGAARELPDALLINPYATDAFADSLHDAFQLSRGEAEFRMKRMRRTVQCHDVYHWAGKILEEIAAISENALLFAPAWQAVAI